MRPHSAGRRATPVATMADAGTTSILIVDDLPEKLLVYRSILEELGQNLVFAGSGAEALRQVLKNDFAVILLDVNMPGMNGFEAANLIRKRSAPRTRQSFFLRPLPTKCKRRKVTPPAQSITFRRRWFPRFCARRCASSSNFSKCANKLPNRPRNKQNGPRPKNPHVDRRSWPRQAGR